MLHHLRSLQTLAILAVVVGEFLLSPRPLSPLVALEVRPRSLDAECRAILLLASACLLAVDKVKGGGKERTAETASPGGARPGEAAESERLAESPPTPKRRPRRRRAADKRKCEHLADPLPEPAPDTEVTESTRSGSSSNASETTAWEVQEDFWEAPLAQSISAAETATRHSPRDTSLLIVFDWDDTLFPTTWTFHDKSLSEEARSLLDDAYVVLTDAMKLGHVAIVTAAARSWIQQCAEGHEGINDLFDSGAVGVWSARDYGCVDADVALAKARAMSAAVWEVQADSAMNLISIGDGRGEWHAAKALARCGVCRAVRAVRTLQQPSPTALRAELGLLRSALPDLAIGNSVYATPGAEIFAEALVWGDESAPYGSLARMSEGYC